MIFDWEVVHQEKNGLSGTSRAKVPGGWLVNTVVIIKNVPTMSSVFVSDPNWYWDLT